MLFLKLRPPDGRPVQHNNLRLCVLLLCCVAALMVPVHAARATLDAVEAAFLYRFAAYVQWPPDAMDQPYFTIAVLADEPLAEQLQQILSSHTIKDRPARVQIISSIRHLGDAQMLYIGPAHVGSLRRLIEQIDGRPILVVTNERGALDAGSEVNFLLMDQHLRFEASVAAAQRARLKLSAELLSVAVRVQSAAHARDVCSRPATAACIARMRP